MDYLFVFRLLFFIVGGLYFAWFAKRAYMRGRLPGRPTWWPVLRGESPIAFWTAVLMASAMAIGAVVCIVGLIIEEIAR